MAYAEKSAYDLEIIKTDKGDKVFEAFLFWAAFAVVVAILASNRGRSGLLWFFIAVVISPLIAGLLVLVLPSHALGNQSVTTNTHKKCPDCAEFVMLDAKVCKHCGAKFVTQ